MDCLVSVVEEKKENNSRNETKGRSNFSLVLFSFFFLFSFSFSSSSSSSDCCLNQHERELISARNT